MKPFLLDTHVFLWWAEGSEKLPLKIHTLINMHPKVYLSAIVSWEIEIKQAKGKITKYNFDWLKIGRDKLLTPLPVTFEHITKLRSLPLIHQDPFDRLLIAQAKQEGLMLLSHDKAMLQYPDLDIMKV